MAWDEELNPIDDPSAVADIGRPVRRGKLPPADDLVVLLEPGESVDSIAGWYGVHTATVRQSLRRSRRAEDHTDAGAPLHASARPGTHNREVPYQEE